VRFGDGRAAPHARCAQAVERPVVPSCHQDAERLAVAGDHKVERARPVARAVTLCYFGIASRVRMTAFPARFLLQQVPGRFAAAHITPPEFREFRARRSHRFRAMRRCERPA
jgi:hypothetical protein